MIVSTRWVTAGLVVVVAIAVGIVVAVVRDPRSDARTENTPAPRIAASGEPSPTAPPTSPPPPPLLLLQRARDRAHSQRDVGCMLRHPDHRHWHFDAMAAYSLRRPGTDNALVARNKVSFCLRDNRRVPGQRAVVRREHFGRCSRNGQQGISPGWVDVYKADLSGQWLELPSSVDDEVVCLDLRADPRGQLAETNEADNATSVALRIDGTRVRRVNSTPCR